MCKSTQYSREVQKNYFMYQKVKFNIFYFIFNFTIIQKTLLSCPCLQIVSLGAGFDTLFFALSREGLLKDTKYFEVATFSNKFFSIESYSAMCTSGSL